jgi:hypothetical protein
MTRPLASSPAAGITPGAVYGNNEILCGNVQILCGNVQSTQWLNDGTTERTQEHSWNQPTSGFNLASYWRLESNCQHSRAQMDKATENVLAASSSSTPQSEDCGLSSEPSLVE